MEVPFKVTQAPLHSLYSTILKGTQKNNPTSMINVMDVGLQLRSAMIFDFLTKSLTPWWLFCCGGSWIGSEVFNPRNVMDSPPTEINSERTNKRI